MAATAPAAAGTAATGAGGGRHLLGLDGVAAERIRGLLDAAEAFLSPEGEPLPPTESPLRGCRIANLFLEDSTRTRVSFEIAARSLGAESVNLSGNGSSVSKGETLLDTARTIAAMGVDLVVVRTGASGGPQQLARHLSCPVVNAGDGRHEHPTQGLLDLLALRRALGDLRGRTVGIVGDVANSRVARSDIHGLVAMGARPLLIGPPTLVPCELEGLSRSAGPLERCHDFDAALPRLDAVVMLRAQRERQAGAAIAADYGRWFRLDRRRLAMLRDHAVVLHPGPANRGFEIEPEVADDPLRSVVLSQVRLGVAVRMAVLASLLGPC